ncbi:MAG TPA: gamma-glutamyltransferase [Streptosporangiaceae bacterium]|jgi:gamma-glutamyltranspeptidase/glutathione hydrolase
MDRNSSTLRVSAGMVCSADHLASEAGLAALRSGGNAADAVIAANAVLTVTSPHLCGLGGDLLAMVYQPGSARPLAALNATGRAGSGADAAALRREGHQAVPFTGDIRAVPVPGCVDGWLALHAGCARLPLPDLLAPAREYAAAGFPAAPLLASALPGLAGLAGNDDFFPGGQPAAGGQRLTRPGVARALAAIAADGRAGFYQGEFGRGLIGLGGGLYTEADLRRPNAAWTEPISGPAWGHVLWTAPPNSQGYLALLGAAIADGLSFPASPDDPGSVHLLAEAAAAAGCDRPAVLHEDADVRPLLRPEAVAARRDRIQPGRRGRFGAPTAPGGTTCVCAVDRDGMGVSLLQSNAAGFGALLFEPSTRINLHNRGLGFALADGHPAQLAPGRRPPHTLSPLIVTRPDGSLRAVLGSRGGDSQPQLLLQLLARVLRFGQEPPRRWRRPAGNCPPAASTASTPGPRPATWCCSWNRARRRSGPAS